MNRFDIALGKSDPRETILVNSCKECRFLELKTNGSEQGISLVSKCVYYGERPQVRSSGWSTEDFVVERLDRCTQYWRVDEQIRCGSRQTSRA